MNNCRKFINKCVLFCGCFKYILLRVDLVFFNIKKFLRFFVNFIDKLYQIAYTNYD